MDAVGNTYIGGQTHSGPPPGTANTFPNSGLLGPAGGWDGFITKLGPAGNTMSWSAIFGGSADDVNGGAVDLAGNVHAAGLTQGVVAGGHAFPVTVNATQPNPGLVEFGQDGFVARFSPAGVLTYATYLGGSETDTPASIAADSSGAVYVTGSTSSANFPLLNAFAYNLAPSGLQAFVTKLNPAGALTYSTFLGVGLLHEGLAIAVDSTGAAYIAGRTSSNTFPMQDALFGPRQFPGLNSIQFQGFVAKLSQSGQSLLFSTYLRGSYARPASAAATVRCRPAALRQWTLEVPRRHRGPHHGLRCPFGQRA